MIEGGGGSILWNTSVFFDHVVLWEKRGPICHILAVTPQLQNGPLYPNSVALLPHCAFGVFGLIFFIYPYFS